MKIQAVPLEYKGITFRSTLEADWACTLDDLGIHWSYEPMALQLPSGQRYLPDFYLTNLHCWAEVKGPHWERMDKAIELRDTLAVDWPGCWEQVKVVILEAAGPGDAACWRTPDSNRDLWVTDCSDCGRWGFVLDDVRCWRCGHTGGGRWPIYRSAGMEDGHDPLPTRQMVRAPRPEIAGYKRSA